MSVRGALVLISVSAVVSLSITGCGLDNDSGEREGEVAGGAEAPALTLALDPELQERLGVALAPVDASQFEERVEGPAIVVDAQPVVQVMAELTSAEAAARQGRAARERAATLFGSDAAVSREVLEAAERQAAADEAALDVAEAQALVAYGSSAPWFDASRRARVVAALTRGEAVLVRSSFPGGLPSGGLPQSLSLREISRSADGAVWRSTDVWLGPADPAVPGPALYAYVDPAQGLVSGTRLIAFFAVGAPLEGVTLPAAAVVYAGGSAWCYVAAEDDTFVRVPVDLSRPVSGGYFQASGFDVGQSVVVAGAGLLLASEVGSAEEED